ncbi:MAG: glycoside hydrolase family 3 C-terminal domain-containing protein [Bacteroidales bacterium]|nr:glycoside hydrolase family 3 C-terminal domain-containing protein [Bacteroidales bacterium]
MKRSLITLFVLSAMAFVGCKSTESNLPVYLDLEKPLEERVEDALSRMTLEEKVKILHAQSKFSSAGVPRLGIPELWTTDGPHGIRTEVLWDEWEQAGWTNDSIVAFPALTALAATWNEDMSALYGKVIGEEARFREKDVLLGPGVNIYRTPLNGRNFEYMGEDPFLASKMVVPYVVEVQKNGVAVCVKHYALNNQETFRHQYDAVLDDRTLYEIYLPAFKAAVQEGGAWSIMGAYNLYKGQHACHNEYLLNDILKGEWGFDGVVISDWGGTHDTDQAITNGLDLEFGTWTDGLTMGATDGYDAYHLANSYLERLRDGRASEDVLNEKVRRVLRLNFRTAMNPDKPFGSICSPEHYDAARKIAGEGIVLLKNDNDVLPVDLASTKKIAVIGENAIKMMTVGGGSSSLKAQHECTPMEGILAAVGNQAEVVYERGYVGDVTGNYNGVVTGQDLSENRTEEQLIADAVKLAKEADVVLFFGGLNKASHQDCEDSDRYGLELPYAQDKVIEAISKVNDNVAVIIISGNAVAMPWVDNVNAILEAWYSGSQAGHAIADVVFGKVNPSGKLPFTFPVKLNDLGAHAAGAYDPQDLSVEYKEGLYVGYRWADKYDVEPLFAFGHGLSYTDFTYGDAKAKASVKAGADLKVSIDVTNSGKVAGKEVVQLYIGDEEAYLDRPVKELKGFKKVHLEPGETKTVEFVIEPDMLKFFDDAKHEWVLEKGKFTAYVGSSSKDIRSEVSFEVK